MWLNPGENGWASLDSDPHTGMCYVLAVATTVSIAQVLCTKHVHVHVIESLIMVFTLAKLVP